MSIPTAPDLRMPPAALDPHAGFAPLIAGTPLDEARYAVVLVHGRGGTAQGMLPIVRAARATDAAPVDEHDGIAGQRGDRAGGVQIKSHNGSVSAKEAKEYLGNLVHGGWRGDRACHRDSEAECAGHQTIYPTFPVRRRSRGATSRFAAGAMPTARAFCRNALP